MTLKEKRGLNKLQKRIRKDEIVVVKTDKSGKLLVMKKEDYIRMGIKNNEEDREMTRKEVKEVEKSINEHTRMLTKVFNIGEEHDHIARVLRSKISNSEMTAPKYYMFKDHKKEEAWRPVVSGCSSNTLGLSNLLSEVIESLCAAVENPFEVISSEDMLYRIEELIS